MSENRKIELLSPAGGMTVLEAALDAGADAAYLGMKHFNARAGARNFTPEELRLAVEKAHAKGAKIYLTLNTMLSQRELGMAARSLAVAEDAGVDAVLITDPAYLAFKDYFPKLDFHFSTQAGISCSAGVRAGRQLGLTRVVLARELSCEEIAAATNTPGIETEVFVQGAMCFSCSGRCLLSSWGGGRSGNRGTCTSPCRVAWTDANGVEDRPMSMHDLCMVDWIDKLRDMGVASLKIEGRLKTADWVSRAVFLYRSAIDGTKNSDELRDNAVSLGDYTGRELTDGYMRGQREGMTGEARRSASSGAPSTCSGNAEPALKVSADEDEKGGIIVHFLASSLEDAYRIAPQRVANPKRAVSVQTMLEAMNGMAKEMKISCAVEMPNEALCGRLLPRNASNQAQDALATFMRKMQKEDDGLPRGVKLPCEVEAMLKAVGENCPSNTCSFSQVDRVRVNWDELANAPEGMTALVCCNVENDADVEMQVAAVLSRPNCIAALPYVMYEEQLPYFSKLILKLPEKGIVFEVNSWDAWQLLKETAPSARFEAGPGLGVLNALAASKLHELGAECVAVSLEIDQEKLEWLCQASQVPLAMTVYSCPPLMMTRAVLPGEYGRKPFTDARNIKLCPTHEGPLTVLRPEAGYDWRNLRNSLVKAAHIVVDVRGAGREAFAKSGGKQDFLFNYDRTLR